MSEELICVDPSVCNKIVSDSIYTKADDVRVATSANSCSILDDYKIDTITSWKYDDNTGSVNFECKFKDTITSSNDTKVLKRKMLI